MGGTIGAVSAKIVLQAGLLMLSARVDTQPVRAVLDPCATRTRIAPDLARRLRPADGAADADRAVGGYHVIGIDRRAVRLRTVRLGAADAPAPLVIGGDLLAETPLEIDFARGRLHLLEARGVARATRGLVRVPLAVAPSGCLEATATREDGTPATVALAADGTAAGAKGAAAGSAVPLALGPVWLRATPPAPGAHACSAGALTLGWQAFGRTRIVVDLAGGALWITPPG